MTDNLRQHAARVIEHQSKQLAANGANGHDGTADATVTDPAFLAPLVPARIRKRVTIPALTVPPGQAAIFRIVDAIFISEIEDAKYGPARVCQVEAVNGDVRMLVLNEVLHAALTKNYPNDKYVGGWFHVVCLPGMKTGKKGDYRDYSVTEIEPPTGATIDAAAD